MKRSTRELIHDFALKRANQIDDIAPSYIETNYGLRKWVKEYNEKHISDRVQLIKKILTIYNNYIVSQIEAHEDNIDYLKLGRFIINKPRIAMVNKQQEFLRRIGKSNTIELSPKENTELDNYMNAFKDEYYRKPNINRYNNIRQCAKKP